MLHSFPKNSFLEVCLRAAITQNAIHAPERCLNVGPWQATASCNNPLSLFCLFPTNQCLSYPRSELTAAPETLITVPARFSSWETKSM